MAAPATLEHDEPQGWANHNGPGFLRPTLPPANRRPSVQQHPDFSISLGNPPRPYPTVHLARMAGALGPFLPTSNSQPWAQSPAHLQSLTKKPLRQACPRSPQSAARRPCVVELAMHLHACAAPYQAAAAHRLCSCTEASRPINLPAPSRSQHPLAPPNSDHPPRKSRFRSSRVMDTSSSISAGLCWSVSTCAFPWQFLVGQNPDRPLPRTRTK